MGDRKTLEAARGCVAEAEPGIAEANSGSLLQALLAAPAPESAPHLATGVLLAIVERGTRPMVSYPGQPGVAALPARTTVDLHAPHVGREVLLLFEDADPRRPIVIGLLTDAACRAPIRLPGAVQLCSDGERMIVSAREQLVLRCGKACITLTSDGRVTIDGEQVTSRATGANRMRGGSVQLN